MPSILPSGPDSASCPMLRSLDAQTLLKDIRSPTVLQRSAVLIVQYTYIRPPIMHLHSTIFLSYSHTQKDDHKIPSPSGEGWLVVRQNHHPPPITTPGTKLKVKTKRHFPISLDFPAGAVQCMIDPKGTKGGLVEEALAGNCAAETRNAVVAADLALKLVIISELLVWIAG